MDKNLRIKKIRVLRDFLIIALSVTVGFIIVNSSASSQIVEWFSSLYFIPAAILMGFFFSLTFTAAISTSVFILLSETTHNPYLIALLGGAGSVIANWIIYKFFSDEVMDDIKEIEPEAAKRIAHKIMQTKVFHGMIPFLAALSFMSPLPDEVGILLLSGSNFKYTKFFLLSFGLHTVGILLILLFGRSIV